MHLDDPLEKICLPYAFRHIREMNNDDKSIKEHKLSVARLR